MLPWIFKQLSFFLIYNSIRKDYSNVLSWLWASKYSTPYSVAKLSPYKYYILAINVLGKLETSITKKIIEDSNSFWWLRIDKCI